MSVESEAQAFKEIMNKLPTGYVKFIPFSVRNAVSFEFNGVTVLLSALRYNEYSNCYMFDMSWSSTDIIYGIPIRAGIDILKQYKTPLPNMYASNRTFPSQEVLSWREMNLFLIDVSVLENVQS
ncbi:putative minor baseplate protein [Pectobacterium phage PP101]|uniref:Putative minor baseplate protein n=1 Tax=Pectobacterium phage PP101 TaxID=1916414 RepID=A0A1J0MES8_9CAUD|nr:virion structural protein [Pectobacterium phage PP101]APD19725.1 putative minor baseplate protein [Pectobacterium phage PP101]